jgi:hypothetical protein
MYASPCPVSSFFNIDDYSYKLLSQLRHMPYVFACCIFNLIQIKFYFLKFNFNSTCYLNQYIQNITLIGYQNKNIDETFSILFGGTEV